MLTLMRRIRTANWYIAVNFEVSGQTKLLVVKSDTSEHYIK